MLDKDNHQTKSKPRMLVPAFLFLFVSLRLLWALWAEQTVAEYLYLLGCFVGFLWMLFYIFSNVQKSYSVSTEVQFFCTLSWCFVMFLAYEIGYHQQTVSFFGISMDSHARLIVYDFILLLPGIIFADQYRLKLGKFIKIIMLALVVTSLYITISAVIENSDALRMSMAEDFYGDMDMFYGLPDYSVVYSLTLIVPWLLYKISQSTGKRKMYYQILVLSIVIIIAVSQFATALLATIVCIMIYYSICLFKKHPAAVVFIVTLFFVLVIGKSSIASWLNSLSTTVEGAWAEKLTEIALLLVEGESTGDLGARADYYSLSFEQFLRSPFFGTIAVDGGKIGGHSTFLDILGLTGLLGAIPYVTMIAAFFSRLRKHNTNLGYRAGVWSALSVYLIFAFTKNIISAISINYTFFVLLPILFFSEEAYEQNKIGGI